MEGSRISRLSPIPEDWTDEQLLAFMTNGLVPVSNNSSNLNVWHNDSGTAFSVNDSTKWHHYEMSVNNKIVYYFVDGINKTHYDISSTLNGSWFIIYAQMSLRCKFRLAQVAVWDICKHTSNFTVDNEPIFYQ